MYTLAQEAPLRGAKRVVDGSVLLHQTTRARPVTVSGGGDMTTRFVRCLLMAGALLAIPAQAQDYHPAFHPETLKGPPAGKPNTVLVLGTPHLSGLPDGYGPGVIEPLLEIGRAHV